MKKPYLALGIISLSISLCNCGTVFNGKYQDIFVESEPTDARVYIPKTDIDGRTPLSFKLERKRSYLILVEKLGYEKGGVYIERKFDWMPVLIDIVVWPTFFIDFATGGAYELKPDKMFVKLVKSGSQTK